MERILPKLVVESVSLTPGRKGEGGGEVKRHAERNLSLT